MENLIWHTEQRIVKELIPLDYNPRKRNEDKQAELRKSLSDFNVVDTPVLNLDGVLISGQRRLEALFELGRGNDTIDVRVPNRLLTEDEVKRYCLLANTHAGEWDLPKLEAHFADIYKEILSLPSFDNVDLPSAEVITREKDSQREIVEDEFCDIPEDNYIPVTKLDDLYDIGPHRLICGDATSMNTIGRLMAGKLADIVFTDPPYNLSMGTFSGFGKKEAKAFVMGAGEMSENEFVLFLRKCFTVLIQYTRKGSIHYICMDWKHINEITTAGKIYSDFKNMIVWNKTNAGMGTFYRSKHELVFMYENDIEPKELDDRIETISKHGYEAAHELVFIYKNGREKHINNFMLGQTGRYRTNVWTYPGANQLNKKTDVTTKEHPTPKPVKMIADALMDCSLIGDIVIDTFIGSGSSIISSEQTERICYGSDLDPAYCDLTIRRYCRFCRNTGREIIIKKNGVLLTKKDLACYGE